MFQQQNKNKSKLGQMETIGITIIVVLVLIGVMFGIQFVLKQKPTEVGKEFRQSQLAANFLNTLAGTTTQPEGLSFTQVVQRCAEETPVTGEDCIKTSLVAGEIAGSVFGNWQKYYFTMKKGATDVISPLGAECTGERESKSYPIPTRAGTVTMKLDLC